MRRAVFLLITVALAGCGDLTASEPSGSGAQVVEDTVPTIGCWGRGPGWPADKMAEGLEGVLTHDEVVEAFTQMLGDKMARVELVHFLPEGPEDTEYRVLTHQGNDYTLGLGSWTDEGPQGRTALILDMHRDGDTWQWQGGGSCNRLSPVLPTSQNWIELHAPAGGLDRDSTTLTLVLNETACASARDPSPYLNEPEVAQTSDAVTVTWTSKAVEGGADCPSNPSVERSITLDEPLGDRQLLDGSIYPPKPIGAASGSGDGQ